MKMLFKKLFRDISRTKGQFISILVVLAVGCFFFAGMLESSDTVEKQMNAFYEQQNYADGLGNFLIVNDEAIDKISAKDNVMLAEGRNTIYTTMTRNNIKTDLTVTTITDKINIPRIEKGSMPKPGECLVDYVYAKAVGLSIDDNISFDTKPLKSINVELTDMDTGEFSITQNTENKIVTLKISGFYHSPEMIYKVNIQDTASSGQEFGMVLANHEDVKPFTDDATIFITLKGTNINVLEPILFGDKKVYNEILVDTENGKFDDSYFADFKLPEDNSAKDFVTMFFAFAKEPNEPFGANVYTMSRSQFPSELAFRSTFNQIKNLVAVFPLIFFLVAAIITFISLSKTVDNQRTQIGIMQAIGITKGNIYMTYLFYALFAALAGSIIGGVAGTYSLPFIYQWVFNIQFNMPSLQLVIMPYYIIAAIVLAVGISLIAAFISSQRVLKEIPAQALRPKPPKKTKKIFLERWSWFWKKTGFGAKMIMRNIFLNKTRILLSSLGVIGCITLLIGGIGLKDRVNFIVAHFESSTGYDIMISTNTAYSPGQENKIFAFDDNNNINKVTLAPQINGKILFEQKSADKSIIALPVGSTAVNLFSDYYSHDKIDFKEKTFAIPHIMAEEMGISIGDTITISAMNSENQNILYPVTVTHIAMQYADQSIYTTYDTFEDGKFGLKATTIYADVKDINTLAQTQDSLAKNEEIKNSYTRYDIREIIMKGGVSILDAVVSIIVIGAAVLAITVIYNITSINVFERTREIATLMVLGYKKNETGRLIIVENMVTTFIGCIIGVPLGYGLLTWLVSIVNSMNIALPSNLTVLVIVICVALAFVFSLIATLLLSRKMQKISMVESLKSVE